MRVFILTVVTHEKLGPLFIPCSAITENRIFIETERLFPGAETPSEITPSQEKMIETAASYADQEIALRYGKRNENTRNFFDRVEYKLIKDHIRPFIERKMLEILDLCKTDQTPFYISDRLQSIFVNEGIRQIESPAQVIFKFSKTSEEILYRQTITIDDQPINIKGRKIFILFNNPCRFILDHRLIWFPEQIDYRKILPFTKQETISIPLRMEKEYFEKFLISTVQKFQVEAEGFPIREVIGEPQVMLVLEQSWQGKAIIRPTFRYHHFVAHISSPAESFTRLIEYAEGYGILKQHRNRKLEAEITKSLISMGLRQLDENSFEAIGVDHSSSTPNPYRNIIWVAKHAWKLKNMGITINQDAYNNRYSFLLHRLVQKYKERYDWFEVTITIEFEGFSIPFVALRKHILQNIPEYQLPDGSIFVIPEAWFSKFESHFLFGTIRNDTLCIAKHHAGILEEDVAMPSEIRTKVRQLSKVTQFESQKLPAKFLATLRDYQQTGYQWMVHLMKNDLNGCLADDMGLGKTLQTIALLCYLKEHPSNGHAQPIPKRVPSVQLSLFDEGINTEEDGFTQQYPSLLVMPTTLIYNWRSELKRFAPHLQYIIYSGAERRKLLDQFEHTDIILTSYGLVRRDHQLLQRFRYNYLILDESQLIRNPGSATYQALLSLESDHRLTLSGTPLENSLTDLWSQLHFLNRDLLGSLAFFKRSFVYPIETGKSAVVQAEAQQKLLKIITPFMMRRTKEEVASELPPKTEQIMYCKMHPEQELLYEHEKSKVRNLILESIRKGDLRKHATLIITSLGKLRQIACHPSMVFPDTGATSGKLEAIIRHLKTLLSENHKVLIFSSYIKHLALISDWMESEKISFQRLTGKTKNHEQVISSFRNDADCRVMLLTLKKGGYGLNLVEADYVMVIDPWWNPAVQQQAIDRVHRIGQKKPVFVYRFITKGTLEEKIIQMQKAKKRLADTFVGVNNPLHLLDEQNLKFLLGGTERP